MSAPAVELEDVWLSRGGAPLLEGVDLRLGRHDYLAILGPNGCGKTTLLKVILGILRPERGRVRVLGTSPRDARGRIGYVPQHAGFDLDFPIRVLDVVLMGRLGRRRLLRRLDREDARVAREALEKMEIAPLADRPIGRLSGGQLQRVLIARALAVEPELLVLDEPTSSLDERVEHSVWEIFEALSHEMAVVLVTHDVGAISKTVPNVGCLNRKLYVHPSGELTAEILEAAYGGPIDLVAHGQSQRLLRPHRGMGKH